MTGCDEKQKSNVFSDIVNSGFITEYDVSKIMAEALEWKRDFRRLIDDAQRIEGQMQDAKSFRSDVAK